MTSVEIWRNSKKLSDLLNKKGRILTWTKITTPSQGYESQTPYVVALVELETGQKLPLQVIDFQAELKVNQKILTVIRRLKQPAPEGVIEYGIKAKPI